MTNRQTRTRTPRRVKSWGNKETVTETLGANAKQLVDLLGGYYAGRGVTSVPGITSMRQIGHVAVKSLVAGGMIDVHFGIRVADKDVDVNLFPIPSLDDASWLWQYRLIDQNLLSTDGTAGVVNFHIINIDSKARRKLRAVDDRLWFYTFNSDATDGIFTWINIRTLLALP